MKKGKKAAVITICSIAALAIGGSAVYAAVSSKNETTDSSQTVEVTKMDLKQCITVTGSVKSDESSSISSELINTEFKSVDVKVGDRVKKGDVIAVLDDSDLQDQLKKAEKALESANERNDISMVEAAGVGVAVANAREELKAVADYITVADNNNGAVAEAINKFILNS